MKAEIDSSSRRVLILSFSGFTIAFAVWMMFGVLSVPIREEFGLSKTQLSWLLAAAALGGTLPRMWSGIMTDRYGGRIVFPVILFSAVPALVLMLFVKSFGDLLPLAVWAGICGNTFSVGIASCSAWFPPQRQGFALGVFGAGNVGAAVTKLIGPTLLVAVPASGFLGGAIPGGWRFIVFIYIFMLIGMACAILVFAPRPDRKPGQGRSFIEMHEPLRHLRVWRFGLYYVVVFGAYVALSMWLPGYYVDVFGISLKVGALLTALYIFPASLLRPLGGFLSDHFGPRVVTFIAFGSMVGAGVFLSVPGLVKSVAVFSILVFIIGVAMGIGKASVYRFIPDYYPRDVGAVGGLVGLLGAAGGIFLPLLFAYGETLAGFPEATWLILLFFSLSCLIWLRLAGDHSLSLAEIEERRNEGKLVALPEEAAAIKS